MSHTPGPWFTEAVSDAVRVIARIKTHDVFSRRPGGIKIILARLKPPQISEHETAANARLMAAAPELLRGAQSAFHLCESLLSYRHGATDDLITEVRDFLRATIAKAQGAATPGQHETQEAQSAVGQHKANKPKGAE